MPKNYPCYYRLSLPRPTWSWPGYRLDMSCFFFFTFYYFLLNFNCECYVVYPKIPQRYMNTRLTGATGVGVWVQLYVSAKCPHSTVQSQLITTFWGNQVAAGFSQLRLLPKTRLTNWPPTPSTTAMCNAFVINFDHWADIGLVGPLCRGRSEKNFWNSQKKNVSVGPFCRGRSEKNFGIG